MPDDAVRCILCGWQAVNTASAAPQPQEQLQAAAVEKRSPSSRVRTLALILTSPVFLLVGCTGGMCTAVGVMEMTKEISCDQAIPPSLPVPIGVAVVATIVDRSSPGKRRLVTVFLRKLKGDLANFRIENSDYSFLPPSDNGFVAAGNGFIPVENGPFAGGYEVEYQVSKRESGKALVKTEFTVPDIPLAGTQHVRATYEATDSDIRLISYKSGPDSFVALLCGGLCACLLGILGDILLGRIARSELQSDRRDVGVWANALAKAKGNVRKAESRYIAMRVKQLRRRGDAKTESASSTPTTGLAPTSQAPIPKIRKRILLGTVTALVVNACAYEIAKPGDTTAADVIGAASVPLICAVLAWLMVSLIRGAKFRASWRVYEGTLLVVAASQLLGFTIFAASH